MQVSAVLSSLNDACWDRAAWRLGARVKCRCSRNYCNRGKRSRKHEHLSSIECRNTLQGLR